MIRKMLWEEASLSHEETVVYRQSEGWEDGD